MKRIQFRFKVIKILGKIRIHLYIPLMVKMRLSNWITNIAEHFIKFEPVIPFKFERFIESEESSDEEADPEFNKGLI